MMRSLLVVWTLAALSSAARADTIISGGNVGGQTWTLANSPYTVQGDITVQSGATLTIEAGVVVQATASSDSQAAGRDTARVEITVDGALVVTGAAQSPVTFTSTSASSGAWYGIVATANATQLALDHATIDNAVYGVVGESAGTTLQISNTTVSAAAQDGIWLRQGTPTLTAVEVIGSGNEGVNVTDAASPTLVDAVIRNNGYAGVFIEHNTAGRSVTLTNCTVNANDIGIYSHSSSYPATINIKNSIVSNSSWGLYNGDGASWSVNYSNIALNTAYNVTLGTGTLSANPLYVSATDLRLTSNSPSRFGGDDNRDQGARPYDGVATPGLHGVLWSNTTLLASVGSYTAEGDVTVAPNVTLTIEPGVTLSFASSTDIMQSGAATASGELVVRGTLIANGTPTSQISIGSTATNAGTWYGIDLAPGSHDSVLRNAVVSDAVYGVIYRSAASNTLSDLIVDSASQYGFWLRDGTPVLDSVQATASGIHGYHISDSASTTFTRCIARGTGVAMYIAHNTAGRSVSVTNCTFTDGGVISRSSGYPATITITGSIITDPSYGVYNDDGASWSVTYSNVWNNFYGVRNVTLGAGMVSANPLFVSATDLRLTSNSPSRFGAPGNADQGALPYDNVPTPGLYGVLWTNTTLTAAGGPYTAAGDLTVGPDTTLTIEPGVTLGFDPSGDIMKAGANTSRGELSVRGRLIADGTQANPITLASSSQIYDTWYGLDLDATAHDSVLDNVIVRNAMYGLVYRSTAAGNTITHFTSEVASQDGVWLRAGTPALDALFSIANRGAGVRITDSASPTLTNCVIRNNGVGIHIAHNTTGHSVSVTNCTLEANDWGMHSASWTSPSPVSYPATITVTNTLITNCGGYGIDNGDQASWTVTYSDLWHNAIGNYDLTPGTGTIAVDPRYVSTTDLHLPSTSPAIDAGASGPVTDADGVARPFDGNGDGSAQWDMGAYEYLPPNACGNAVVEGGETCDDGAANGSYGHCDASCSALGPRCGDGVTNGPEQCDDANASNTDACLDSCVSASCGDGFVQASVEACDDGNSSNTDACLNTCIPASCGDGFVQAGVEQCDDGNPSNADACLSTCVAASCGDGFVQAGVEQCDDGNTSNADTCLNVCKTAACGDGFTETGVEECDDGNTTAGDGCSEACVAEQPLAVADDGGGCCDAGRDSSGSLLLAALVGLLALRPGRSRRYPASSAR